MSDLINREALKEDLFIKFGNQLPKGLLEEIDNASAVDISGSEYFPYRTAYFNGFADGISTTRSKGEWIDYSEDGFVECPICGHLTNCEDNIDELHYCWNCGAKMQKGDAV